MPDAQISGILLQKQIPESTHLIVGGIHDEQFGPVVMFGMGGVLVELFKDVSFRIAPVTEVEALEMIKEIKAYPALSGYRGSKMLDIKQVVKTIIIISELISNISTIKEVELKYHNFGIKNNAKSQACSSQKYLIASSEWKTAIANKKGPCWRQFSKMRPAICQDRMNDLRMR